MAKTSAAPLNYIHLTGDLYLIQNPLPEDAPRPPAKPPAINHHFIRDRSGSMYCESPKLTADLKAHFRKTLRPGDTVTLGWFSGNGEFGFTVKGFRINGPDDFPELDKYLDAGTPVIGMTCFSESLAEFKKVVADLAPNGNPNALTFLTDGYPTVYPLDREMKAIDQLTREVGALVQSTLIVGYGPFYNKELLTSMAQNTGGVLTHSADLKDFAPAYDTFTEKARGAPGRVRVGLRATPGQDAGAVFTIDDGEVRTYNAEPDGTGLSANVMPSDDSLWIIGPKPYSGKELGATARSKVPPAFERAMYAAALVLVQHTRTDLALEILGKLGDKAIIDAANNAFTLDEYGAVETLLTGAIGNPDKRFTQGRKKGYLPARDAFCLVDLLKLLQGDDDAFFLPRHNAFEYRRIGPPSKVLPGYPEFKADIDVMTPFNSIVMHDTHLNLSFNTVIPGTVELPEKAPDGTVRPPLPGGIGMMRWKTKVWRTYAVVRDGFLNVKKLPVTLGQAAFERLVKEGVIRGEPAAQSWQQGRIYILDLARIPIMNRGMADGLDSAKAMGSDAIEEVRLMGILKALRDYRKQLEPERAMEEKLQLTPEQETFLKAIGIRSDGTYNPPSDRSGITDYYMAKTFQLKVEGETLPSIKDVQKKLEASRKNGKPLALGTAAVAKGIEMGAGASLEDIKAFLTGHTNALKEVRARIQGGKFAILLGQRWFHKDFKSRQPGDCKLEVGGVEVQFILGEERVDF